MGRYDDDMILCGGDVSCGGVGYIARYGNVLHFIIVSYGGLFTCINMSQKMVHSPFCSLLQLQCVSKDLSNVSCGGVGCICAA